MFVVAWSVILTFSPYSFLCYLASHEMDTVILVQILDEIACISHSTNTLRKGMNPIILHPAMGKQ